MNKLTTLIALAAWTTGAFGQYNIKTEEARTGSRIRGDAAKSVSMPLNKRFDEFTSSERKAFKAVYETMAEDDEPPFPKDGLKQYILDLREAVAKRQASGRLVLVAQVNSEGRVEKVDIYASPDDQISRFAAITLGRLQFKPAKCDGVPCRMDFPFSAVLNLE